MKKSKDYEPSKFLRIITQNKKLVSTVIIFLYIAFIILMYFMCKKDLQDTSFVSEIISGIFVVGGLVVSVLQYTASCVENTILRDQEKKIKAAEMANQFQAEMIPLLNTLTGAYKHSGLDKTVLNKLENSELIMFDKEEVDKIMLDTQIDVSKALVLLCVGYLFDNGIVSKNDIDKDNGNLHVSEENRVLAENEISTCINKLSNKLEYFGICFNSGIADEDTVYQSLHRVFFQCVHMLYIFIFGNNISESDRLFSNVSSLYIRWRSRYMELVEKENEELINRKKDVQQKIVVKAKSVRR